MDVLSFELGELATDFIADILGFPEPLAVDECFGDDDIPYPDFGLGKPDCFELPVWLTGDKCFGIGLLLNPPDDDDDADELELDLPETGELENLRPNPDGDKGAAPSFVFTLTLIGRDNESCLIGIFSGGPIGLSSRLRLRFLSFLLRSSERLLLEPEDEADEVLLLLVVDGFLPCELPGRSAAELGRWGLIVVVPAGEEAEDDDDGDDESEGEMIGVMVMDDLRLSAGAD